MVAVRSADTAPEVSLRRALYAAGIRGWRCHYKRALGKPDLAWPALRVAVFVDGAFWHGHSSRHKPGRSGKYWDEKIARNVERDREVDAALKHSEWTVVRVWDFEVARELPDVVERIARVLLERASASDSVGWQRRLVRPVGLASGQQARGERGSRAVASAPQHFGENLRRARHRANLSRQELAGASGLHESTIGTYERGEREPRLATILKLAGALGIDSAELLQSKCL